MFRVLHPKLWLMLCIGTLISCEPENLLSDSQPEFTTLKTFMGKKERPELSASSTIASSDLVENLEHQVLSAVIPSECGATEFSEVQWKYLEILLADTHASPENLNHYLFLNRQAANLGIGSDYFGENGEHTRLVYKLKKDLERFWNLPRDIRVLGQHNETLNDREKLADIYWYSIQELYSREEAYELADAIIKLNRESSVLPESPFFSSNGLSTQHGTIIIGDGLIKLFSETGLDEQIVWTGILAHEWAHQVQFHYLDAWYANLSFDSMPERTRTLELEADFFAGYYMTHKRGATYNWKRAEEFFELYYQSGDCSFEFEQHHGTPLQRKRASYEGFLLADSARKKGEILSAEALHEYFMEVVLEDTVAGLKYL